MFEQGPEQINFYFEYVLKTKRSFRNVILFVHGSKPRRVFARLFQQPTLVVPAITEI